MLIKIATPDTISDKTFDSIISKTSCIYIVEKINEEFVFAPKWELDNLKFVDEIIKNNIEKTGIKCYKVSKGGGVTVHGDGDLEYSLIVPKDSISDEQISLFIKDYIEKQGYSSVKLKGNDIIVDDKKVSGVAHLDYDNFDMVNIVGMVTLTDHQETFKKLFGQLYNDPNYKIPGCIPLDKDKLISAFVNFLEDKGL